MSLTADDHTAAAHPLEAFMQQYLDQAGGAWEPVEPQVYDLLLPEPADETDEAPDAEPLLRIAFDPEALPEHDGAVFMSLGTPLVDRMLADARRRGAVAHAWRQGLNLHPFDLPAKLKRVLDLPQKAKLAVGPWQPAEVTIAIFYFTATYHSDEKEQDLFHSAIDLSSGRQVRHLEKLLVWERLDDAPAEALPPADAVALPDAYQRARDRIVRTVSSTANLRHRQLQQRLEHQQARMRQYYRDLIEDLDTQARRAAGKPEPLARIAHRRQAAMQEQNVRLAELSRKYALHTELQLSNLLLLHQPRLRAELTLTAPSAPLLALSIAWDPVAEAFDPPDCPRCASPSLVYSLARGPDPWRCQQCQGRSENRR